MPLWSYMILWSYIRLWSYVRLSVPKNPSHPIVRAYIMISKRSEDVSLPTPGQMSRQNAAMLNIIMNCNSSNSLLNGILT